MAARPSAVTTRTFWTVLSTNYLPKALALGESLRRHEDGARLKILFIDHADDEGLPQLDGVDCLSTACLGLPRDTVMELVMSYDLVEFATAIKPLLFKQLLRGADQVFYLDPDTFVLSPMTELSPALEASAGGILLTPHFLRPPPRDAEISDGHCLLVDVNNLGFGGYDHRSSDMLDWWWGHLRTECLYDPLAGLFVDQKWMDIGSTLFQAASFRHAGYNVGVANLSERPLAQDADGYFIASTGELPLTSLAILRGTVCDTDCYLSPRSPVRGRTGLMKGSRRATGSNKAAPPATTPTESKMAPMASSGVCHCAPMTASEINRVQETPSTSVRVRALVPSSG
jgi:hypothetical protein